MTTSTVTTHTFENAQGQEADLRRILRNGTHSVFIVTEPHNGGAPARAVLVETTSEGDAIEVLQAALGAELKDLLQVGGPAFSPKDADHD